MLNVWPMTEKAKGKRAPVVERATGRPIFYARYGDGATTADTDPVKAAAYAMESFLRDERQREAEEAAWTPERERQHYAHLVMGQRVRELG